MQGLSMGGGTSRAPTRLRRPTSNVRSHLAVHKQIKGFFCKKGKPSILIAMSMFVSKLPHTHIA